MYPSDGLLSGARLAMLDAGTSLQAPTQMAVPGALHREKRQWAILSCSCGLSSLPYTSGIKKASPRLCTFQQLLLPTRLLFIPEPLPFSASCVTVGENLASASSAACLGK